MLSFSLSIALLEKVADKNLKYKAGYLEGESFFFQ